MSKTDWTLEQMDRRNGWKKQERKLTATQNLARVLGFDHGDRCAVMNLTEEKSWTSW